MTRASRNHNRITERQYVCLSQHLQDTPCEEETNLYYNEHPCLIVEVLSDSTQRTDRTEKRLAYQTIERLQEYVLLSQDSPYLEIYRRRTEWQRESFAETQSVTLESVNLTLVAEERYA